MTALGYIMAFAAALFVGKLVAGAVAGILVTPLVAPVEEKAPAIPRYIVPLVQGIAMGGVAVLTAQWVLGAFQLNLGWAMVAAIVIGFVVIFSILYRHNPDERSFHLSAGLGELTGVFAAGVYLLGG